jgi:hypothetical protein
MDFGCLVTVPGTPCPPGFICEPITGICIPDPTPGDDVLLATLTAGDSRFTQFLGKLEGRNNLDQTWRTFSTFNRIAFRAPENLRFPDLQIALQSVDYTPPITTNIVVGTTTSYRLLNLNLDLPLYYQRLDFLRNLDTGNIATVDDVALGVPTAPAWEEQRYVQGIEFDGTVIMTLEAPMVLSSSSLGDFQTPPVCVESKGVGKIAFTKDTPFGEVTFFERSIESLPVCTDVPADALGYIQDALAAIGQDAIQIGPLSYTVEVIGPCICPS